MAEYYVAARRNDNYEYAPVAGPFPSLKLAKEAEDALSQLPMDHAVNRQFSMNTRYSASKTSVKQACGKWFSLPTMRYDGTTGEFTMNIHMLDDAEE